MRRAEPGDPVSRGSSREVRWRIETAANPPEAKLDDGDPQLTGLNAGLINLQMETAGIDGTDETFRARERA